MLISPYITTVVDFCIRRPWWIIAGALLLATGAGVYAQKHFAIKTDISSLIAPDLPWTQRSLDYMKEFPQRDVLVVIDAPTPEIAERAASELTQALEANPDRFRAIGHPASGRFFEQNGFLFLSTDEVARLTDRLTRADALIGTLASDPSLRGILDALSLVFIGLQRRDITFDDLARPLTLAADTIEASLSDRPASFSWQVLASGNPAQPRDLRRFLQIDPVLDYSALQPGRAATDAIAKAVSDLDLKSQQVRVRQSGRIPIDDDEFGTIRQNAGFNAALTLLVLLIILWLAMHSWRIIFAVFVSLFVGLAIATAAGLLLVGALNVISVAFFVLFVGLGVDFGIQFSVRYRAERHDYPELRSALRSAAQKAGGPLTLAAVATAVGFSSFLPTAYRGLAELGEIAGTGMIIAFITSVTVLPSLLAILNPPGELYRVGFAALAPVDRFLERHRMPVVVITILAVVVASPLLLFLPFDFDPMHLKSPAVESTATYLELKNDPETGANAIDIAAPDLNAANSTAQRLAALPQVAQARTLRAFIPDDQDAKLKLIHDAAMAIDQSLNPDETEGAPSDQDTVKALSSGADMLSKAAGNKQGPGPEAAQRLARLLSQLANADAATRQRTEAVFVEPLHFTLDKLRATLQPERISADTIPPDIAREWVAPDGRARIEVLPKGDPNDTETVRNFVQSVMAVEPNATGPAVELFEAGNTVVHAFIQAGAFALSAIAVLLLITLRRIRDVLLTLVPLVLAGAVTLELCVLIDLPLNFANIIALPLLLGIGVAFKIYYVVAWRAGKTSLLQSSLTRAVVFSAMTTATAFGSLWLSSHPGTSSMGKMMALALVCTMAAAVLFQPALMGPPREKTS